MSIGLLPPVHFLLHFLGVLYGLRGVLALCLDGHVLLVGLPPVHGFGHFTGRSLGFLCVLFDFLFLFVFFLFGCFGSFGSSRCCSSHQIRKALSDNTEKRRSFFGGTRSRSILFLVHVIVGHQRLLLTLFFVIFFEKVTAHLVCWNESLDSKWKRLLSVFPGSKKQMRETVCVSVCCVSFLLAPLLCPTC